MKIGIVTWWRSQGVAYLAVQMIERLIKAGHTVQVFAHERHESGVHPSEKQWLTSKNYNSWIGEYRPDWIIFLYHAPMDMIHKAKRLNIKICYAVFWERSKTFKPSMQYSNLLISPTNCCRNHLNHIGFSDKTITLEWSLDIKPVLKPRPVRPYKLLYLAGFPQIRRRGDFVFRAFEEIAKYEDIHLTVRWMDRLLERDLSLFHRAIQSHVGKVHCSNNRSREGILQDYQDHDLMLWPTCREGLGLIGLESVYHGTPVVSFNVPPLHEFLINGINSVLSNHSVGSSFEGIPEIHQPSYESFRESLLVAIQNIDRLTETTSLPCYSRINTFNKQWDQFLGRL